MEKISLTMKEAKRFDVIQMALRGEVSMSKAAEVLGVCLRQAYRIKKKIKEKGVKGVVHGNRGSCCKRKLSEKIERRIVDLRKGKYKGFNDTHFTEKLLAEGIKLSREKVRRVLRKAGIASPRKRKPGKYRSRRDRRDSEGLMLQTDGSHHDWLEGRGPKLCLIGVIDDATSKVPAVRFEDGETTQGYFKVFERAFESKGLPHSIYADRHSIFRTDRELTIEEQLAGIKKPLTQAGRALDELGITLIPAGSPQAKGRIERLWGTFQDRLISELRLAGAKTKKEAQAVLNRFVPEYNRRFGRKPACMKSAWRKLDGFDLKRILCWKHKRIVAKDNTISFKGLNLQLPKVKPLQSLVGKKVTVLVLRNRMIEVYYKNLKLAGFANQNIEMEVA